ncbi:Clavaminate synthase-like protein [Lindgomyces ingoldianus]|uniref:Clavaminate synthase-like protein n=1 Tax=Lindgomyces ingoldianus TaxID=673940 RepID=A0ACB6RDZ3_9PLEO|nr:Clavaminate synthase-like protein [Lindgomyces ingoldianus]KAF2476935.1 Clavaminate synthase-like protein [Lindgomyces ingoldianus]
MSNTTHTTAPIPLKYQEVPPTTADLDYADLITLDLSLFNTLKGKHQLATQLKTAISTLGFFYVTNFGLPPTKIDEQFGIAQSLFNMPADEKMKFRVDAKKQGFFGYKPAGSRPAKFGLRDNLELFDDPKYSDPYKATERPAALENKRKECEEFGRHMHFHVLYRLLYLCGIIMELPTPSALWDLRNYDEESQCHLRYMLYHPRTPAELEIMEKNKLEENVYGHTDFGSLTLLMRQPVAGLQVRVEDANGEKKWKWVRPVENSLTVNVADTLSFLTGGYLKSTVHRVVLPPSDQRHVPRYGVIYFSGPNDNTLLRPIESPVLKRILGEKPREGENVGLQGRDLPPDTTTAGEWVRVRFGSIDKNYQTNKDNAVEIGNRSTVVMNPVWNHHSLFFGLSGKPIYLYLMSSDTHFNHDVKCTRCYGYQNLDMDTPGMNAHRSAIHTNETVTDWKIAEILSMIRLKQARRKHNGNSGHGAIRLSFPFTGQLAFASQGA